MHHQRRDAGRLSGSSQSNPAFQQFQIRTEFEMSSFTTTAADETETLSREFNELAASHDPPSRALTEMARWLANRFELDVCSVYIIERNSDLLLAATMGLNQASVGQIRMKQTEGLAGLVAERAEPVSVADASSHPRFKLFPEAGEERFRSFLGYPVMFDAELQGVLVVQTVDERTFTVADLEIIEAASTAMARHVRNCRLVEAVA